MVTGWTVTAVSWPPAGAEPSPFFCSLSRIKPLHFQLPASLTCWSRFISTLFSSEEPENAKQAKWTLQGRSRFTSRRFKSGCAACQHLMEGKELQLVNHLNWTDLNCLAGVKANIFKYMSDSRSTCQVKHRYWEWSYCPSQQPICQSNIL